MTEQELQQLTQRVWDANTCNGNIRNAKDRIDYIERYGFKVMLGDHDVARDLPTAAFEKIRLVLAREYQKIIDDNTKQLEQL